ncbi:carcinine transporter-like [Palaemon carinicauda]|uniref:carcinine transporter-like n=1 Tax=Palaemon carinicauda TaxID=392227 RepID=UPI0035B5E4B6
MGKELEDLFAAVGSFGPYQKWMVGFVLIPVSFIIAYVNHSLVFQLYVPEYWCHVPGRTKTSLSLDQWKNLTIPRENGEFSSCHHYQITWENESDDNFTVSNETVACSQGWEHDRYEFLETVATLNNWLCDKEKYSSYMMSMSTIGNAVGTLVIPVLADKYIGRRVAFYIAIGLQAMFTAAVVWAPTFEFHLAFRFLAGLGYQCNYQMPFMTVMEFVSVNKRTLVVFLSSVGWIMGFCCSSLVSWILPDWRYQALACCVPMILSFMYIFCLPESPRWLMAQGKSEECVDVFIMIAQKNRRPPPERAELERKIELIMDLDPVEHSLLKIIRHPKLCMRALLLFITGCCVYIVQGVVNSSITIYSNYYLDSVLISLADLPGCHLGCLLVHYFGRRFTFILTSLFGLAFCATSLIVFQDKWKCLLVMALIKLSFSMSIYALLVYSTEIFPTTVRSTGFAWISVCGFTAVTASSYIINSNLGTSFPYWIMLALSGVSFLATLFLPETIGLPLPQNFQEAEDINVGRPLTSWIHMWNYFEYFSTPDPFDVSPQYRQELEVFDGRSDRRKSDAQC